MTIHFAGVGESPHPCKRALKKKGGENRTNSCCKPSISAFRRAGSLEESSNRSAMSLRNARFVSLFAKLPQAVRGAAPHGCFSPLRYCAVCPCSENKSSLSEKSGEGALPHILYNIICSLRRSTSCISFRFRTGRGRSGQSLRPCGRCVPFRCRRTRRWSRLSRRPACAWCPPRSWA